MVWILSLVDFKNKVILFLLPQWKEIQNMLSDKIMYVTSGINAFKFTANACCFVAELYSDQKEVDTWILLHAKHASSTYNIIVIATPDTDVFIMRITKPCTQLQPPPPTSFQPPPSSTHLHPAHFHLHPALCNTPNNIWTKILHVIEQFPQIWAKKLKIVLFDWQLARMVYWRCWFRIQT